MTTQSTAYPETNIPPARKAATDGYTTTESSEGTVPELKAKLRRALEASKTRAVEWKTGAQEGIRERPIQSVLIAAAVGTVIGVLLGRRSR